LIYASEKLNTNAQHHRSKESKSLEVLEMIYSQTNPSQFRDLPPKKEQGSLTKMTPAEDETAFETLDKSLLVV
jgi:hypothetical protein